MGQFPEQVLVAVVFSAAAVVLNFSFGRAHLARAVVAVYLATGITLLVAPVLNDFFANARTAVFVGVFLLLVVWGERLYWAIDEWPGEKFSWRFTVFALASLGMIFVSFLKFLPPEITKSIVSDATEFWFGGEIKESLWFVAPLIAAMILRR